MTTDAKQLPRTEEVALLASEQRTVEQLAGTILLDRYRLIEPLGSGGAAVVYRAEHTIMHKPMAVKILRPENASRTDFVRRFLEEARTVAKLRHENIVDIVDIGRSESGVVFCVMEWLDGEDLGTTIDREGPIAWNRAQRIVLQVCRALIAAHEAGIVHRDVKPQNCLRIRRGSDADFIKLLDFGIAKDVAAAHKLTMTGMIMGTVGYMPPEQARGGDVDIRADVYAVGALVFELVSGRPVFDGDNFLDVLMRQATEPAPRLASVVHDLPTGLDDLVARALERNREARFGSMTELAAEISAITHRPERAISQPALATAETVVAMRPSGTPAGRPMPQEATVIAPAPVAGPGAPRMPSPPVESWPPAAAVDHATLHRTEQAHPRVSSLQIASSTRTRTTPALVLVTVAIATVAGFLGVYAWVVDDSEVDDAEIGVRADEATRSEPAAAAPRPPDAAPAVGVSRVDPAGASTPDTGRNDASPSAAEAPTHPSALPTRETPSGAIEPSSPPEPEEEPNKPPAEIEKTRPRRTRATAKPRAPDADRMTAMLHKACGDKLFKSVRVRFEPGLHRPIVTVTPPSAPLAACIDRNLGMLRLDGLFSVFHIRLEPRPDP